MQGNTKLKGFKKREISHPVIRIFTEPAIQKYFQDNDAKYLEFGDIQYLLCKRKPSLDKWEERWGHLVMQIEGLTFKEVYNSKEHLNQEIRKVIASYPGLFMHIKGKGYAISPSLKSQAMENYIIDRLKKHKSNNSTFSLNQLSYFGFDFNSLDHEEMEFFFKEVHEPLMEIQAIGKLRILWTNHQLNEFCKSFEDLLAKTPKRNRGSFIGYVYLQMKWFISASRGDIEEYQTYLDRLKKYSINTYHEEIWNKADLYTSKITNALSAHKSMINIYIQEELGRSTVKDSHDKIVVNALNNLMKDNIISEEEHKWLIIQQQMSKRYQKNFGIRLTGAKLNQFPQVVIDTTMV